MVNQWIKIEHNIYNSDEHNDIIHLKRKIQRNKFSYVLGNANSQP